MIRIQCPCGKSIDLPDHFAGKSGKCKACGAALAVPAAAQLPAVRVADELALHHAQVPETTSRNPVARLTQILRPIAYRVPNDATVACPACAEAILPAAKKCKHCGEYLDQSLKAASAPSVVVNNIVTVNHPGYGKLVADVLSIVPGLGHLYTKRNLRAVAWFAVVVGLYFLFVPLALFTHLVCVVAAVAGA